LEKFHNAANKVFTDNTNVFVNDTIEEILNFGEELQSFLKKVNIIKQ